MSRDSPFALLVAKRRCRCALLPIVAALVGLTALPALSAVPPPLGPVATVITPGTPSFGIGVLRLLVRGYAQKVVDDTNADLAAQGKWSRVSLDGVTAWSPYRTATQHADRPNQYIVRAPFMVEIGVDIPAAADRTIFLPIDVNVSCEGWHQSAGQLHFVAAPGPASIEGGNIFEDIVPIRGLIDANVRSGFTPPDGNQLPFSGACATLGAIVDGAGVDFDAIIWSPPIHNRGDDFLRPERIEVTLLTLRRLPARGIGTGAPIGDPIETITLEAYANFHAVETLQLTMRENALVPLELPTMVLLGEPTTGLVVIGNVRDDLLRTEATGFRTTSVFTNYSPGIHALQLNTEYWLPGIPPSRKPTKALVATYDITYQVTYVPPSPGQLPGWLSW